MNSKLLKLAAAGALSLCATASALAGSVTQPGETVGLASGAPLPEGLYFVNTGDWGRRSDPADTSVAVDIPVLAWSTPWTFLGARVQFLFAGPVAEVGVHRCLYYVPPAARDVVERALDKYTPLVEQLGER